MKNKKFLSLAVAALALSACGKTTTNTKIVIWATAAEEAVIKDVVETYNKEHSSSPIEYEFKAVSEADAGTTLGKDPTLKGAPALFLCADDHIYNLQSKNIILEITGSRASNVKKNNTSASVIGASYNDKLYGYPVTSDNGFFLWYNSEVISDTEAGSLEALLKKAKDSGKKFLLDIGNGWYAGTFLMSPSACGTSSLTWKENDKGQVVYDTTWDSEVGVKVSEYATTLLKPYYDDGTFVVGSNEIIVDGFENGSIVAAVSGTWMENDLKTAMGTKANYLKASKLPEYHPDGEDKAGYQMATFTGSKLYAINKTRPVEEQKTADTLAQLLTSKEAQLRRFEIRQSLPCNVEAQKDKRYTDNTTLGGAALNAQVAAAAAVQSTSAQDRYWEVGKLIGNTYIGVSALPEGNTWAQFLKTQMDGLRNPAV